VELQSAGASQELGVGKALRIDAAGGARAIPADPEAFLTLSELNLRSAEEAKDRYARWGTASDRLRRDIRALRQALSATRELDVARIVFDHAAAEHRWPKTAADVVRGYLDTARSKKSRDTKDALDGFSASRLRRRIRDIGEVAAEMPPAKVSARLRARLKKRERELARAVRDAGAVYDIDKLHEVRLATKKRRYTLELAQDALGRRRSKAIATLKAEQRVLGELHDLQMLESHIGALESTVAGTRGPLGHALSAMCADLEADTRQLHGKWLKQAGTKGK